MKRAGTVGSRGVARCWWPLALASLLIALPAVASAENAGGTPDIGGLASLQQALGGGGKGTGLGVFQAAPGTFDPAGPTPEAVARAIEKERITKDGYPRDFQVTEVYVVTAIDKGNPDAQGMWAVRYRTNLRLGFMRDPVFIELATYDPSRNIPLGVGGFFSVDPAWTMQGWAADLAGQNMAADGMRRWLAANPAQAGQVAAAGGVAGIMAALLGLVNSFGSVPKVGSGRNTALTIPSQLRPYRESGWTWVMDPKTGKRQLQQTLVIDEAGDYFDQATGLNRHFEKGETYFLGKPLAGSIFDVPDPSAFGNQIGIFAQPVPDMAGAGRQVAETVPAATRELLAPSAWATASTEARANTLRATIRAAAEATGVDTSTIHIDVRSDPGQASLGGMWTPSTRTLFVNTASKDFADPKTAVATALHELRHAAQTDPKNGLGADANYRALMDHNTSGYKTPGADYTRYAGQLMERDAQNFGDSVARGLVGGK